MRFQWDITYEIRYLLFRNDNQHQSQWTNTIVTITKAQARRKIHAGSLRILFKSPRVRSNVLYCPPDFLPATKGQRKRATIPSPSFPSPFEYRIWPKYWQYEKFSSVYCQDTRNKSVRFSSRKSNSYELARLREAIFLDEFMRNIISRESRNFDLHLVRRPLLAEKFRRRRGFLGS